MYQTGPTWTIIFNRKEITGLRQTGHKYIHYLLQHPNRTFPTKEMEGFVSSRPSREDFEEMTGSGSLQKKRGKLSKEKEDNYIKQMEELKEYREILNNHERMESEKPGSSDIEPELLRESKKAVSRYLKDYKSKLKSGGVAYEKKEMDRKQQQRISKSIERAVKEIKKYDTATFEHFMNALKPFNTKNQCYGTSQNIKWTVK